MQSIAKKVQTVKDSGRNFALIVVSESVKTIEGGKAEIAYDGGEMRYGWHRPVFMW